MEELKIIRYLLDEIEAEQEYNNYYDKEREKAERTADKCNEGWRGMSQLLQVYASRIL